MHAERTKRLISKPAHLLDILKDPLDILPIGDQSIVLSTSGRLDHLFAFLDSILEIGFLAIDVFTFTFYGICLTRDALPFHLKAVNASLDGTHVIFGSFDPALSLLMFSLGMNSHSTRFCGDLLAQFFNLVLGSLQADIDLFDITLIGEECINDCGR